MAEELTEDDLGVDLPEHGERAGQHQGSGLRHTQHVERRGVVAEAEGAILARTPPQTLLSQRDIFGAKPNTGVHFERREAADRGNRLSGSEWSSVGSRDELSNGKAVCVRAWRALIFAPQIEGEAAVNGISGSAGHVVRASAERAAVIVCDGLAEVITVPEERPGDFGSSRVNGFETHPVLRRVLEFVF